MQRITNPTLGIIYISFGETSAKAALRSLESIRRFGIDLPAITVGTHPIEGTEFMGWRGHAPWTEDETDPDQRFRAGYVKPMLQPISPFDYTLYLDADTIIRRDIMPGFWYLQDHDICAVHYDSVPEYTMEALKRHINQPVFNTPYYRDTRRELDFTISVIGGKTPIVNSGVIFFRKSYEASFFFAKWYLEWLRFTGWEEQLAFLRAEHGTPGLKIKKLPMEWNHKHIKPNTIIWHKMGGGSARDPKC
jgi:hypothetical protein